MKGYSFIASVYVLRSVLPILSSLSKVFQSGTIDFSHICPSLQYTIDKLKEIADNQTPIVELKKDLSEGGRLSELQLNATENQIEKTSSMLRKYTESLISNIEKRFSDSLEILKAFDIFNPFSVPERETLEFTVYGNEHIETMINNFFKDLEESKKEEIRVEWKKLKYNFLQWKKEMTLVSEEHDSKSPVKLSPTQKVLQKILQKRVDFNVFFPHLVFLAEVCQSIPVSNAWPERGASTVKRLKTQFRSRLKQDMMTSLMTIAINGSEIGKENEIVKTSVQKWRSNKNRQKLPKPVNQKDTVCATEENQIETVDISCQTDFQLQSESENESAIVREEIRVVAKSFLLNTWDTIREKLEKDYNCDSESDLE